LIVQAKKNLTTTREIKNPFLLELLEGNERWQHSQTFRDFLEQTLLSIATGPGSFETFSYHQNTSLTSKSFATSLQHWVLAREFFAGLGRRSLRHPATQLKKFSSRFLWHWIVIQERGDTKMKKIN